MDRRPATPQEVKALAYPLRLRILRLCREQARTNKQLAERLGEDPGTTLYHVRILVGTGFLAPEEPRTGRRGAWERPYRSTGKSLTLECTDASGGEQLGHAVLDAFVAEVGEAGEQADLDTIRLGLRLGPNARDELRRRLEELAEEFAGRDEPDGEPLGLFIGLHRQPDRPTTKH